MTLESLSTEQLVERARDPGTSLHEQHAAFTELVRRTQHVVFALALARLQDVEDAKDASQGAFATAWHRLHQLRDAAAFEPWLKSIVVRECARRRRQRTPVHDTMTSHVAVCADAPNADYRELIATALEELPEGERHVTVLFYFLGYSQPQIAHLLRLQCGTVGKRLHSARLRLRRQLPRSVRCEFVRHRASADFAARVRRGLLDEYVGEYRFDRRPDLVVSITRDGDAIVSHAAGQRHTLISAGEHSLATAEYDGEGRFHRSHDGEVTHFVYYEFGKRLGVAHKIASGR